jgi:hypothetical protein
MDFSEYGSRILPEQFPAKDRKKIDARDTAQFAQQHIPGAARSQKTEQC